MRPKFLRIDQVDYMRDEDRLLSVVVDGIAWEYSGTGTAGFALGGGAQHVIGIQTSHPSLTGTATSAAYMDNFFQVAWELAPVPEPTTLSLLTLGGLALLRRRR